MTYYNKQMLQGTGYQGAGRDYKIEIVSTNRQLVNMIEMYVQQLMDEEQGYHQVQPLQIGYVM